MLPTLIPLPAPLSSLHRYPSFASHHIPPRSVDVWVPPGYATDTTAHYPVLYMHDGQNVFDPTTAYNGITWGVAEALLQLQAKGLHPLPIVVGIWNHPPARWREYMPQQPFAALSATDLAAYSERHTEPPYSDAYLQCLVTEVKPFIDATYRTQPGPATTFIMGSSMGGLISLYAVCQYPEVFAGAACLSTHWPAGGPALVHALAQRLPRAGRHKLYFDFGTETLDALYEPLQTQMDALLPAAGYTLGRDWRTEKFPGAEHAEPAWRARVHIPLQFLLMAGA